MGTLQQAVRQLAGTDMSDDVSYALADVVSVNTDTLTCSVQVVGGQTYAEMNAVSLMPAVDDGFLQIPAIDSTVLVMWSKRTRPCVVMFSRVQDIYVAADNLVTLQGDDFGGIPKVMPLTTKLNNLENLVNDLILKYNSHVHPDPASGVTGVPTVVETGSLTPTQQSELENTRVVHGN